jgi:hypothetical protein
MATPAHTRVTFSGIFTAPAGPVEIWSCNLNCRPLNTGPGLDRAAHRMMSLWGAEIAQYLGSSVQLTRTRVALVGPNGHVDRDANGGYRQVDDNTLVPGTFTNPTVYPTQAALVISLQSARAGASGKGRLFMPAPGRPLDPDYRLDAGYCQRIAASWARVVANAQSTDTTTDTATLGAVVVASPTSGVLSDVTSVRVGRVIDTMRSRRNALLEDYAVAAIPEPAH